MEALERELHYTFRNRALLEEALNHSSYANNTAAPESAATSAWSS